MSIKSGDVSRQHSMNTLIGRLLCHRARLVLLPSRFRPSSPYEQDRFQGRCADAFRKVHKPVRTLHLDTDCIERAPSCRFSLGKSISLILSLYLFPEWSL